MSKILAVADVHISDYKSRNPVNLYRLHQTRTVAQNIVDVARAEGCEYIVFAGDTLEHPIESPYIEFEVKLFFDTVMPNFKEGYIIYGNHDMENKSGDQDISDSMLGLLLPPNLHYAHQQEVMIDGCRVGFNNWQPKFDLSWINGKLDILFTHATICYTTESAVFKSQELDETKFDKAFCGDIHRRGEIGKYVSIGIPQKCKMGDADEFTGVVVDCATKQWDWVNLDPHGKIMKFVYTQDLEQSDIWDSSTGTFYVYKPESVMSLDDNGKIKMEAWDEIETMINNAIIQSNLQDVHTEVLKNIGNIEEGEVDFNFTLLHFSCENWRSIDHLDLDFAEGDKILIRGNNGSGKSSLLSAIKYAFIDVGDTKGLTSLKPFIKFGAKKCWSEVTFLYQGNICKIRRGTESSDNCLWINDEQMKYSSKANFNEDVRKRFPFVEYLDAFFFDADHNQFIGGMDSDRKIEIMSKFLKLDKIDTYHQTAVDMSEVYRKEANKWEAKLKEAKQFLAYIDDKLANITVPVVSKDELVRQREEGMNLQRANAEWNRFNNLTAQYNAQISEYTNKIAELETEKAGFRDPSVIDYEISAIQGEIQNIQARLIELGNIGTSLRFKQKELQDKINEGNAAWTEAQNIGVGKVCSHCGQPIKTSEALEKHKAELLKKVDDLRPVVEGLRAEVSDLLQQQQNSAEEYNALNQNIVAYNSEVSKRMTEKLHQSKVLDDINKYIGQRDNVTKTLASLGSVPRVDLPDNFMETMASLQNGISAWELWEVNMSDRQIKQNAHDTAQAALDNVNACMADLAAYIKLTGPTGLIYEEIMRKLAVQFSDKTVNYVVDKKTYKQKERLNLNPQYFNKGNYVDYTACSSGQKTILDINFLSKIITRLGLLVFDEFLKHLSEENHDNCIDVVDSMNIGCILISSHMENITSFNNRQFSLSLDASGVTKVEIL